MELFNWKAILFKEQRIIGASFFIGSLTFAMMIPWKNEILKSIHPPPSVPSLIPILGFLTAALLVRFLWPQTTVVVGQRYRIDRRTDRQTEADIGFVCLISLFAVVPMGLGYSESERNSPPPALNIIVFVRGISPPQPRASILSSSSSLAKK